MVVLMPDGGHSLNRHQRRRRAAHQRRYSIQDFHDDTAGVFSLGVVTPAELAILIDRRAGLAAGVIDWLARIEETRPLCATCEFVFTREAPPAMWLIAHAVGNPDARGVMLMGACEDCCTRYPSAEGLIAAAADQLKRGAWPDLRTLDPVHFHGGGRA
jgi:hypothetical protein